MVVKKEDLSLYEHVAEQLERRIKRIEENPDPRRLKTNKLRYELQLKALRQNIEAWRQGKVLVEPVWGGRLLLAMGFALPPRVNVHTAAIADRAQRYLDYARAVGFPADNSCDMTYTDLAQEELGETVPIAFHFSHTQSCTVMTCANIFLEHTLEKRKVYHIDTGFKEDEANLKHVTDQLLEFIEWAEKEFPGIKYDEDKLIELQAADEECRGYANEIYQMLKHKPTPIAGYDVYSLIQYRSSSSTRQYPEYYRALRDEVAERIEKRIAAVPGEKLRMLWAVTRPFFFDPFSVLAKWGIAVFGNFGGPCHQAIPVPRPAWWYRKLTPLEKMAAELISSRWHHPGAQWVADIVWTCRDLQVDALINYNMLGCTATLGLRKLVEDAVEKELGIPTLQLEGKQLDHNYADAPTITAKLDEFAQMCLSRRGLA